MTFSKKLSYLVLKSIQKILGKLRDVEQELEAIGDNMKQLEISAEKAQEREEKLLDKIHTLLERLKVAEARFEYGEMNISKLNLRYTNHFHLTNHTSWLILSSLLKFQGSNSLHCLM